MKFTDFLLRNFTAVRRPEILPPLSSIRSHSDQAQKGSLFVALKGQKSDGHDHLKQAVEKGASALLVEKTDHIPSNFKGLALKCRSGAKALPKILNQFYDFPSQKLFMAGVTGSNGKTSFCYLLERIFSHCGWPTALMGTVERRFGSRSWPALLTTPDPIHLFERLNDFVRREARAVVMELSSHALDQNRAEGIDFKALVFTNLSQDHLDYHGSMENYFQAKRKIFFQSRGKHSFCLFNQDDEYGRRLKEKAKGVSWTYGQSPKSDFCFKIKRRFSRARLFELSGPQGAGEFFLPLPGDYNVYNAVSALACAVLTGFKPEDCARALKDFPGIPGRLEKLRPRTKIPFDVFVDYAHTPAALACALSALRPSAQKLILVFGCGGDRDKGKRPLMAKAAVQGSHTIFFTADNPRSEDPLKIAEEALKNLSAKERAKITVEPDRQTAIQKALKSAGKGDFVLIAGKGHERFQIAGNKKIPFCDRSVALKALSRL